MLQNAVVEAMPNLMKQLSDSDDEKVMFICRAIGNFGDIECIDQLVQVGAFLSFFLSLLKSKQPSSTNLRAHMYAAYT